LLSDNHNIARIGGFLKKYFVNIWLRQSRPFAGKNAVKLPTRLKAVD
jgi:hypothetical protein